MSEKELYDLSRVGVVPEGIFIEVSNEENFACSELAELVYIDASNVYQYGVWGLNKGFVKSFRYARHPIPKELTDEEIVGEGYIRIINEPVYNMEYRLKEQLCNEDKKWKKSFCTPIEKNLFKCSLETKYYRIKKPVPLTDTERHSILLDNVGAGKCLVKDNYGRFYNNWYTDWAISLTTIKLPNTSDFVEITDELLIQVRDGVK